MNDNPLIVALTTYGLTALIALLVAAIIQFIGWAVRDRNSKASEAEDAS